MRKFAELYAEMVRDTPPREMAEAKRWVARNFYEPGSEQYERIMAAADELERTGRTE
jgi:hypothetical protein